MWVECVGASPPLSWVVMRVARLYAGRRALMGTAVLVPAGGVQLMVSLALPEVSRNCDRDAADVAGARISGWGRC